jgi:protein-tyrosine phosphatase
VPGFVDLHCHWVPAIDDGARSFEDTLEMLRGLRSVGFDTVVATPHMRPGMFDNDKATIARAFGEVCRALRTESNLPHVELASEHFFDDVVFARMMHGEGLPYPGKAVLIEFGQGPFPVRAQHRFFDLRRVGLTPVLAHPERYQPVWKDDGCLDPLLDAGADLLLDVCSLTGKYGTEPRRAAEKLLEQGAYEAACSDAHRPEDAERVLRSIERLETLVGSVESRRLLDDGPRSILRGEP